MTARKPEGRSRVGNRKALMSGIDTHSVQYREYRDVVEDLAEHMGSAPTAVQRAIIEESAGLIIFCRAARLALLQDDTGFDVGKYTTATNTLRRLLSDIGQERRMKDITPSIESIKAKYSRDSGA